MNRLEYKNYHLFPEMGDVQINRVYELLEILQYSKSKKKKFSKWKQAPTIPCVESCGRLWGG